jgi:hypothetical protein
MHFSGSASPWILGSILKDKVYLRDRLLSFLGLFQEFT